MDNEKLRYRVSKRNFFTRFTWVLMGLSIVFTVMANWGFWHDTEEIAIYLRIVLPVASCLLYMLIINHMGEKGFFLTFIPVMLGAGYLIITSTDSGAMLHSILCIALCIVVTISYIMTVFGTIRTKWLLLPIVGLPLIYRIAIEDREMFFSGASKFSVEWFPELAVLCMMLALISIVFAMRKRDFTKEKPIEEVLVELENNPDEEITIEETEKSPERESASRTENEAVIIAPSGDKYE